MEPEHENPPEDGAVPTRGLMIAAVAALLLAGCLIVAVSAWVLVLRDRFDATPTPPSAVEVRLVATYTPRPATATPMPTFTSTPSRTPAPTATPVPTEAPTAAGTPMPSDTTIPPATDTPALTGTPEPSPTPSTTSSPTPTATASPTPRTYTVQKGDTLYEIARRFGVTVQALSLANGITDPALIRPGQVLVIPEPPATPSPTSGPSPAATAAPAPRTYTVQKGDTLSEIALRFGVTVQALAQANGITDPALIRPGQVLVIPEPTAMPTPGARARGVPIASQAGGSARGTAGATVGPAPGRA